MKKTILKQNNMSVKSKEVVMRKSSGFCYTLSAVVVDTPKGKLRTISIRDQEVQMADKPLPPPYDEMGFIVNDGDFNSNKQQLKEFCTFVLNSLKEPKKNEKKRKA